MFVARLVLASIEAVKPCAATGIGVAMVPRIAVERGSARRIASW